MPVMPVCHGSEYSPVGSQVGLLQVGPQVGGVGHLVERQLVDPAEGDQPTRQPARRGDDVRFDRVAPAEHRLDDGEVLVVVVERVRVAHRDARRLDEAVDGADDPVLRQVDVLGPVLEEQLAALAAGGGGARRRRSRRRAGGRRADRRRGRGRVVVVTAAGGQDRGQGEAGGAERAASDQQLATTPAGGWTAGATRVGRGSHGGVPFKGAGRDQSAASTRSTSREVAPACWGQPARTNAAPG